MTNAVPITSSFRSYTGKPVSDRGTLGGLTQFAVDRQSTGRRRGAFWQGKQAMRIAVSNWSTTEADIDRSADAMVSCYRGGRRQS